MTNVTHDFFKELKYVIPRAGPARRIRDGQNYGMGCEQVLVVNEDVKNSK